MHRLLRLGKTTINDRTGQVLYLSSCESACSSVEGQHGTRGGWARFLGPTRQPDYYGIDRPLPQAHVQDHRLGNLVC